MRLAWTLVMAGAIGAPAMAQMHTNEQAGYKIRPPKHYEAEEPDAFSTFSRSKYCIDHFTHPVGLPSPDGWSYDLEMTTFFFPSRAADPVQTGGDDEDAEKDPAKEIVDSLKTMNRNYRSFRDFATANISGFFFEEEKESKVAGLPAVVYEMKFEKLTEVEQRWVACAYQVPGGEFAVMFNCTDQHFRKKSREFQACFKSLKIIAEKNLQLVREDSSITVIDRRDDDLGPKDDPSLSPEEREKRRVARRELRFEQEIQKLPKGWSHERTEHFLVLSHVDARYTKTVQRHIEALRSWLDETFTDIGEGVVEDAIVRIYESARDAGYESGSGITVILGGGQVDEFEWWKGRSSFSGGSPFEGLNHDIVQHWFAQRSPELWNRMPYWLERGLGEYVADATLKGSRLVFAPDSWERQDLAIGLNLQEKHRRERSEEPPPLLPMVDLFSMSTEEQADSSTGQYVRAQNASLLRFLVEGPGQKWKLTEGLLSRYLAALLTEIVAIEKRLEAEDKADAQRAGGAKTEEELLKEEDEAYKKRREQTFDKIEQEILGKVFQEVFGDWSEDDWEDFDRKWMSYAKKGCP